MCEWKECKLGDVVSKLGDGLHGTPKYDDDGDYYFINGNNLYQGKILIKENTKRCSREEYEKYKKELNERTILISINGTLGNIALYNGEKCFLGKSACYFNVQEDVDKSFIQYVVTDKTFQDYINIYAHGTTIKNVSLKTMREYPFLLPPLPEQRAIASVLSSLDDKIDLLHRQNQTLEAMAETLFRQWFVEEADEGWEDGSLLELIQLVGGGTPKTAIAEYWDGDIYWLAGGDIATNHKSFVNYAEKRITEAGLNNSSAKVLPKYATVISARGTVGKYCLLAEPMAFSQSNYGVLPNIINCFFFTYVLINHVVEELQSSAYGSVFDTITTTTFKENKVPIPTETEIVQFEKSISPYFHKMFMNKDQIRTLKKSPFGAI
jgi:type I restriction enzyme S subunit